MATTPICNPHICRVLLGTVGYCGVLWGTVGGCVEQLGTMGVLWGTVATVRGTPCIILYSNSNFINKYFTRQFHIFIIEYGF